MHILFISPMATSLTEIDSLLKLKNSLTNSEALYSWNLNSNPCEKDHEWVGLVCNNGKVTRIQLARMGLAGQIDVFSLIGLTSLRTLNLANNSLSGSIPLLDQSSTLNAIYLSGNQFSGQIPSEYFEKLGSVKRVWLSYNNFWGEIPSSLVRVPSLISLHLENNQFSGPIPLLEQPSLVSLNLSNNKLEGEIPYSLLRFNAGSFEGNDGICGEIMSKKCNQTDAPFSNASPPALLPKHHHRHRREYKFIAIGVMVAFVAILGLMTLGIFVLKKRQQRFEAMERQNLEGEVINDVDGDLSRRDVGSSREKGIGDMVLINEEKGVFGLQDLMKAAAEVIGEGTLGSSYKAAMCGGLTVVVKRIKEMKRMGRERFDGEIRRFGRLNHPNVLTPLAYHYRIEEKLLIHEYIPKGSLHYLLHGDSGPHHDELNWPMRLKIIKGIARGLAYIHTELAFLDLPHGNLKSSNILLGPDYDPLITDYGYSALINANQAPQTLFAYKSPEAAQHHHLSPKCDIYCLGIIILEILTGKFPSQYVNNGNGGTDVVQGVNSAIQEGREAELFDPNIASSTSSQGEMVRLLHIGANCTDINHEQRLKINEVVTKIEKIQMEGGQEVTQDRIFQGSKGTSRSNLSDRSRLTYSNLSDRSGRKLEEIQMEGGHEDTQDRIFQGSNGTSRSNLSDRSRLTYSNLSDRSGQKLEEIQMEGGHEDTQDRIFQGSNGTSRSNLSDRSRLTYSNLSDRSGQTNSDYFTLEIS